MSKTLGLVLGCVLFLGAGNAFGNLITNGDFISSGGVQTDYTAAFVNTGPGQAMVLDPPGGWNLSYTYPTGTGNKLVADGATSYMRVWFQDNIPVTASTTYQVSFDAASLTGNQFANLGLYVRPNPFTSIPLATIQLDSSLGLGVWKTASGSFTPSASGLVEFFIGNLNVSATGNAFAIDNISVQVPEPSSLALLGVGSLIGLGVYTRRRRKSA